MVLSIDEASTPFNAGGCGKFSVNGSALPLSPLRLRRVCVAAAEVFTSVKVVVQFSCAAICGMEPIKFRPVMVALCCPTTNDRPATVKLPERSPPELAATWNVTVPLPLPEVAPVSVTKERVLLALHAQ